MAIHQCGSAWRLHSGGYITSACFCATCLAPEGFLSLWQSSSTHRLACCSEVENTFAMSHLYEQARSLCPAHGAEQQSAVRKGRWGHGLAHRDRLGPILGMMKKVVHVQLLHVILRGERVYQATELQHCLLLPACLLGIALFCRVSGGGGGGAGPCRGGRAVRHDLVPRSGSGSAHLIQEPGSEADDYKGPHGLAQISMSAFLACAWRTECTEALS